VRGRRPWFSSNYLKNNNEDETTNELQEMSRNDEHKVKKQNQKKI